MNSNNICVSHEHRLETELRELLHNELTDLELEELAATVSDTADTGLGSESASCPSLTRDIATQVSDPENFQEEVEEAEVASDHDHDHDLDHDDEQKTRNGTRCADWIEGKKSAGSDTHSKHTGKSEVRGSRRKVMKNLKFTSKDSRTHYSIRTVEPRIKKRIAVTRDIVIQTDIVSTNQNNERIKKKILIKMKSVGSRG